MKDRCKVLIPDYLGGQVLSGIRSLSKIGYNCDLAWNYSKLKFFLRKSKYIEKYYKIVSSEQNTKQYINDIINIIKKKEYDVILPFGNDSFYAITKYYDKLKKYAKALVPPIDSFNIAHSKIKTLEMCKKLGIDFPKSFFVSSEEDILKISKKIEFPVVIKANSASGVLKGLRYAFSEQELIEKYKEISFNNTGIESRDYTNTIVQEYIIGNIYDANTLTINGDVNNIVLTTRLSMYPIYGGVGAFNKTIYNEKLKKTAIKILEYLNWNGPANLEFKLDKKDNKFKLLEINPKLWGTLDLSIKAGVNFPKLICDIILGKKVKKFIEYRENIRYFFLFPQFSCAFIQHLVEKDFFIFKEFFKNMPTYTDLDFMDFRADIYRIILFLTGQYPIFKFQKSPYYIKK